MLELKRLAAAGELGTILQIEANFSQDKFLSLPADNWRLSSTEAPAGPMTATGIHMLDLAVSLLGRAERAFALARRLGSNLANGDTLGALVSFRSGANLLLSAILATPFDGRFAVYGNKGWAEARRGEAAPAGVAGRLPARARRGDVIGWAGDLGSGKTTFARAFIRALGWGEEEVPSPLFTLVEVYAFAGRPPVWHFDLYRLTAPEQSWELGIEDALAEGVSLIEWPERLGPLVPPEHLLLARDQGPPPTARVPRLHAPSARAAPPAVI